MVVARGEQKGKGRFRLVVVLLLLSCAHCFCSLKRGRCEFKIKEPRNREKQEGFRVKTPD